MYRNFYTGTEEDLRSGSLNAVSIVTGSEATYGVTVPFMANYTTLANNFDQLYTDSREPATRTSVVIENKNAAKKLLKDASVNLARIATATSTVTNAMLLALRMNERVVPTPVPVPATAPTVDVLSVIGRLMNGRVHDPSSEGRGMPFGAVSANIYSYVGPTPPNDPREYHFEGPTTRAKFQILFPNTVPSGATIWLSASWVSARGQISVASQPISFTLQGGAITASA